jgi:hypothetical protein
MIRPHVSILEWLRGGLLITFLSGVGGAIYLDNLEARRSPVIPVAATGQIYPTNVSHGKHVYVTKQEALLSETFIPLTCFFSGSILLWLIIRKTRQAR